MTARSVPEWAREGAEAPSPLLPHERGRGAHIASDRLSEIERFCAMSLRRGAKQSDVAAYLRASRSRVSRWSAAGLRQYGCETDHRLLRHGNRTLVQMMWARIDVRSPNECWPWRGAIKPNGYGALNYNGKTRNAHRLVYETLVSEVPDGLVLDHKCENPICVNPAHLHPVTQSLNISLVKGRAR